MLRGRLRAGLRLFGDPGSVRREDLAGDGPYGHAQLCCSLALQVQEVLNRNPPGGHVFCFRGQRGNLLKMIWHDGQETSFYERRLERGGGSYGRHPVTGGLVKWASLKSLGRQRSRSEIAVCQHSASSTR
jgi:hypothetical protein